MTADGEGDNKPLNKRNRVFGVEEFYFFNISKLWQQFKAEHFSFWMICCYLFFEYVRPQAIFPAIDFLPWAQVFLLGSAAGAFLDKSVKWVSHPMNFFIVLFAIVIYVSSINAYYPDVSALHYIDFYGWFVIYFLIINIVNTKQRFYIFLILFIVCAAKISIGTSKNWAMRGFAFTNWGLTGPSGHFQNSGELAILMLVLFPLAYLLWRYLSKKISRFDNMLLILFAVTPVLTIMGASSRGSQIALVVQLVFLFRKRMFKIKPLIGIIAACFILFAILPDEQKDRFRSAGGDDTSRQRLLYWKHGWDMMKDHPWLGVGYFNFPPYYQEHFPEDVLFTRAELPHNIFIQVGTDGGWMALIPFLSMLYLCFSVTRKIKRKYDQNEDQFPSVCAEGLSLGIMGFAIAGQFVTVAYYPFLWIGMAFIISLNNVYKGDGELASKSERLANSGDKNI